MGFEWIESAVSATSSFHPKNVPFFNSWCETSRSQRMDHFITARRQRHASLHFQLSPWSGCTVAHGVSRDSSRIADAAPASIFACRILSVFSELCVRNAVPRRLALLICTPLLVHSFPLPRETPPPQAARRLPAKSLRHRLALHCCHQGHHQQTSSNTIKHSTP